MIDDPTLIDGRYRLIRELGAGAFGAVHLAKQVVLGHGLRDVALKLFHADAVDETNVERQMNDALAIIALLADLSDWEIRQHFVTIYDLGVTRERKPRGYVAMELVHGGNLAGRIRQLGKFSLQGTLHYLLQVCRAIAFMHEQRFVHSDLKPENVLVFRGRGHDLAKIGDFGLSGRYRGVFGGDGPSGGTLSYMAPEALQGIPTTPGGDVFSIGVMAYEMLTGENPYNRVGQSIPPDAPDHDAQMVRMQLQARETPLSLRRRDFAELSSAELTHLGALVDVINRMLAPAPAERYPSAREVLAALERIREGKLPRASGSPTGTVPPSADPPKSRLVDELISDCEYLLEQGDWAGAAEKAAAIVEAAPDRPEGYSLKGQICVAQADAVARSGNAKLADRVRRGAVPPLREGIFACAGGRHERPLRQQLADVHRQLGDDASARMVLKH